MSRASELYESIKADRSKIDSKSSGRDIFDRFDTEKPKLSRAQELYNSIYKDRKQEIMSTRTPFVEPPNESIAISERKIPKREIPETRINLEIPGTPKPQPLPEPNIIGLNLEEVNEEKPKEVPMRSRGVTGTWKAQYEEVPEMKPLSIAKETLKETGKEIARGFGQFMPDYVPKETPTPENILDFIKNIPESAVNTLRGIFTFPRNTADVIAKPIADNILAHYRGEKDFGQAWKDMAVDIGKNIYSNVDSASKFMGEPIGVYGLEKAKERWLSDPVGSLASTFSYISPAISRTGREEIGYQTNRLFSDVRNKYYDVKGRMPWAEKGLQVLGDIPAEDLKAKGYSEAQILRAHPELREQAGKIRGAGIYKEEAPSRGLNLEPEEVPGIKPEINIAKGLGEELPDIKGRQGIALGEEPIYQRQGLPINEDIKPRLPNQQTIKPEMENPSLDRSPEINAIRIEKTRNTQTYAEIKNIDKNKTITIYRAIPKEIKGGIEPGDFVAVDKEIASFYAKDLIRRNKTNEVKYVSLVVPAGSLKLHPNHQASGVNNEFIYNPEPEVKPTQGISQEVKEMPSGGVASSVSKDISEMTREEYNKHIEDSELPDKMFQTYEELHKADVPSVQKVQTISQPATQSTELPPISEEKPVDIKKLLWGKNEPTYIKQLSGQAVWGRFLNEAKEVAYIDKGYTHKQTVYFYKNKLVRVSDIQPYSNIRYMHEVSPDEITAWLQRKNVAPIAEKFGAKVSQKKKYDVSDEGQMEGLLKPSRNIKTVIEKAEVQLKPEISQEIKPVSTHKYPLNTRIKLGKSPQTYTITEQLKSTPIEIENGEIFYNAKNEKTGKIESILESEIKLVKEKIIKQGEQNVETMREGTVQSGVTQGKEPEQVPVEGKGEGEIGGNRNVQTHEEKVESEKTKDHIQKGKIFKPVKFKQADLVSTINAVLPTKGKIKAILGNVAVKPVKPEEANITGHKTTGGYSEEALNKPIQSKDKYDQIINKLNTISTDDIPTELNQYKPKDLSAIAKKLNIKATGSKNILVDRIWKLGFANKRGYGLLRGESKGGHYTTGGYSETARGEAKELGGIKLEEEQPDVNLPKIPIPTDLEIFNTPELVEMSVALLDKYPELRNKIKHALGVFYPKEAVIKILKSLGADPKLAALVLSHEIGHGGADYLPERTMKRGNILGRIGSFKSYLKRLLKEYPNSPNEILTQADRDRFRQLALDMAKVEIAKQKSETGTQILPKNVLELWNDIQGKEKNPELYEYIIRLSEYEKKQIILEALKGEIKSFKLTDELPIELDVRKKKNYEDLIRIEIIKRKLYEEEVIRNELKKLTQIWRPFVETPKSMKYRYKSSELYADAISVLLNNPQLLYDTAPTFYKAFFSWIDKKPDFRDVYWSIVSEYKKGTIGDHRAELGRAMTDVGEMAFALPFKDWEALGIKGELKEYKNVVKSFMVDKFSPLYDTIKNPDTKRHVKNMVEAMIYKDAETGGFYLNEQYHNGGLKQMIDSGIDEKDIAEYVKARRIIFERKEIFNPGGHNPETAQTVLDSLKKKLGDDYYKLLEDSIEKMWAVRQKEIIDVMEKSGKYSPELIESIKNNKYYVTFDKVEAIAERYGRRITPKIFKQKGMVSEVANPYTSTLLKDMAILDFINTDIARETAVKGLVKDGFTDILDPEYVINHLPDGKIITVPRESKDARYKLVTWFEKGKVKGKYLPVSIADVFENDSPRMMAMGKLLRKVAQPYREIFTRKRPYFWVANPLKDMAASMQSLHGWNSLTFPYYALKNIPSAVRGIRGKSYDAKTQRLYKGKALVLSVNYQGMTPEQTQLERMFIQHGMVNPSPKNLVLRSFERFFAGLDFIGDVSERMTKLGVAEYLDTYYPDMLEEDKMHLVRWVGSPAWLVGGTGKQFTNNLLPFSNAMTQGYRFQSHVAREHPIEYSIKATTFSILPKVMMYLGLMGMFGDDIRKFYQGVSKYGMLNYYVLPIGFDSDGKSIALYVPMAEPHRFLGGVIMNAFMTYKGQGKFKWSNLLSVLDYTADQFPGIVPAIGILKDLGTIISGHPVYDNFRGRYAIGDRDLRDAKDMRTALAYFKYFWNQQGLGILHRFDTNNIDEVKTQLQTYTGYPVVSDFVGRYIRIENAGESQQYMGAIEDTRTEASRERLDLQEAIDKLYKGISPDKWNDNQRNAFMIYVATHNDANITDKLMRHKTRVEGTPLERALASAITIREKQAVIQKYFEMHRGNVNILPENPKEPEALTEEEARQIYNESGGDADKAREIARQRGKKY